MKKLIVANWKMNPASVREAVLLARTISRNIEISKYRNIELVIAPPAPFLIKVGAALKKIAALGAQNVFWEDVGPFTGEISWRQLNDLGARSVIVGHSERRMHCGESDEMIQKKLRTLLAHGLGAVLCVGERERESDEIPPVVEDQLQKALVGVPARGIQNLAVAYEPVWAISTMPGARPDTPENAFCAALYIRKVLTRFYGKAGMRVRVLYGGSVSAANAALFLREGHMDGLLVGGASLKAQEFINIVVQANQV